MRVRPTGGVDEQAGEQSRGASFSVVHLLVDAAALLLAFVAAYFVRFHAGIPAPLGVVPLGAYCLFWLVSLPVWWLIFAFHGLYFARLLESSSAEYSRLPAAVSLGAIGSMALSFLIRPLPESRLAFLFQFVFAFGFVFLGRWAVRSLGRREPASVVLIGTSPFAELLRTRLRRRFGARTSLREMSLEEASREFTAAADEAVAVPEAAYRRGRLEVVCLESPPAGLRESLFLLAYGGEARVRFIPAGEELMLGAVRFSPAYGLPEVRPKSLREVIAIRRAKRVADVLLAGVGLVVLSPLMAVAALLVRLSSPGTVFFRHLRLGTDGRAFRVLKFRTMREDVELSKEQQEHFGRAMKLADDPRATPIGAWLRRTSLDELPQLINVFRGEMSLVGPRPIVEDEMPKYGRFSRILQSFPPGLTGLWQVSGRSDVSYQERIDLDIYYIMNWSPALDAAILLRTLPALLSRRGAY